MKKDNETEEDVKNKVAVPNYKAKDKPVIVVELKWNKSADTAITQISNSKYRENLTGLSGNGNVILVEITYDRGINKKHRCIIEKYKEGISKKSEVKSHNYKEIIEVCTFLIAVATSVLKCYVYIYNRGYNEAIGLNGRNINISNQRTIYDLFLYLGFASIIIFLNVLLYLFCREKMYKMLLLLFMVQILIFFLVCAAGIRGGVEAVVFDAIKNKKMIKLVAILGKCVFCVMLMDAYGIAFTLYEKIRKKKIVCNIANVKFDKYFIFGFVMCILVEGVATYFVEICDGANRTAYSYAVEKVSDMENDNNPYTLKYKHCEVRIYPILYEDENSYIISYLYKDDEGNYNIKSNRQKTISKMDVETYYTDDIFSMLK